MLNGTRDYADALATNGEIVHIHDLDPDDLAAVTRLHEQASDRSIYLRFFTVNEPSIKPYLPLLTRPASSDHRSLGAFVHDTLVGVATMERTDARSAEIGLLVADEHQHDGIGTLLLEYLVALARDLGIRCLVGDVLAVNTKMLDALLQLGFPVVFNRTDANIAFRIDIDSVASAAEAIERRERTAGAASLQPLLAPRSVAVIGAGRVDGAGHEVLKRLLTAGFTGSAYAVNPNAEEVLGVRCYRSPADLPEAVDLVVIAVPVVAVLDAVRAVGKRGCRAAVLLNAGFGESGTDGIRRQDEVLAQARRYGMRLLGPNCIGLLNTDPAIRLDATFGDLPTLPSGGLALASQSGAFGVGLAAAAADIGMGVSQMVSVGNKADVGGNDLLLAWGDDPRTDVIALYLESVGDPRRFVRIAREVAAVKPILAVKSGRTPAGRRAGQSHTAAAASSDAAVDALFRAAGVLRMQTTGEMLDAARVLGGQPLPAGPRLAILGNSGGPEIVAADAAAGLGLVVDSFHEDTATALRALGVAALNPLDLGAAADPRLVRRVLGALQGASEVDAILTVFTSVAVTDIDEIRSVLEEAAAGSEKPLVAVEVGARAYTRPLAGSKRTLSIFTFPEPAVTALANAHRYSMVRNHTDSPPEDLPEVDVERGRRIIAESMAAGGGWLRPDAVCALLESWRILHCPTRVVRNEHEAVEVADGYACPVAIKLAGAGLHKTDIGGVRLGVWGREAVQRAAQELLAGDPDGAGLIIQPMEESGLELIAGTVNDEQFGPLVLLGAGGVLTEVLDDRSLRIAPVSGQEADSMMGDLRMARLLDGYRGSVPVCRSAVRDVLVRLSALAAAYPDIAELDLNPLVCRGERVVAVDARIRVAPAPAHPEPWTRRLREPA